MSAADDVARELLGPPARGTVPLTRAELEALAASPKLHSWLTSRLGTFGRYALREILAGHEPVGLAEYLGQMREEIAREVV